MTPKKPAVSYKGNEWDVTGSQHRHKEAADFCAWYFWAGIFSHISLVNKMVGCAEKKKTATRKQKATCHLCKDWKAKLQAPAITFNTHKPCCRSEVSLSLFPTPSISSSRETKLCFGQGWDISGRNEKRAEVDWPIVNLLTFSLVSSPAYSSLHTQRIKVGLQDRAILLLKLIFLQ